MSSECPAVEKSVEFLSEDPTITSKERPLPPEESNQRFNDSSCDRQAHLTKTWQPSGDPEVYDAAGHWRSNKREVSRGDKSEPVGLIPRAKIYYK